MPPRRELFPHVIEMNHLARRRLGCCVYLLHDPVGLMLIDIGYEDTVAEIIDMIRRIDFSLANCRYLVATHADVDLHWGSGRRLGRASVYRPRPSAIPKRGGCFWRATV